MTSVTLNEVSRVFDGYTAVRPTSLSIEDGEFVVLLGPSGCGKTTMLRMIAGFVPPTSGSIHLGKEDVTRLPPRLRNIGMVFQNYALFPNMSVADNVGFGLKEHGFGKPEIRKRVGEMLELVQLSDKGDRWVTELSGGQQQRVALARALAFSPRVLLMDEPLAALDLKLREQMQIELRRIQRELGITTVLVTHDQHEAMGLADRIVIMAQGEIQQEGSSHALYSDPANKFVADFIGKSNLLSGIVADVRESQCLVKLCQEASITIINDGDYQLGEHLEISVRPEQLLLEQPENGCNSVSGEVEYVRFLGNVVHYGIRTAWGQSLLSERPSSLAAAHTGDRVDVFWRPQVANVFRSTGREATKSNG